MYLVGSQYYAISLKQQQQHPHRYSHKNDVSGINKCFGYIDLLLVNPT